MRKQAIQLLMAVTALCSLSSGLKAQTYAMEVHIPFAFHAANQLMAPGDYIVSKGSLGNVQQIRAVSHGGPVALRAGGMDLESKGGTRAVFNLYGGSAYLAQVWTGSGSGFALGTSRAEKAARESASIQPATVTILASLR